MRWQPDAEERRWVKCAASMALDTLCGDGVADRASSIVALRSIANGLERLSDASVRGARAEERPAP